MRRGILLILFISGIASAQPSGYLDQIRVFWRELYPRGGEELYCGTTFAAFDRKYNIEHVFPMHWVTRALRCGDRSHCRRHSPRFNEIEADMHNLYPARADLNQRRGAMAYDLIEGENWVEPGCDLEIDSRRRRVEPRPQIRGNIARAMLYMADRYHLELYTRQRRLLLQWHTEDPPDEPEIRRAQRIRTLQGNDNTWIR